MTAAFLLLASAAALALAAALTAVGYGRATGACWGALGLVVVAGVAVVREVGQL